MDFKKFMLHTYLVRQSLNWVAFFGIRTKIVLTRADLHNCPLFPGKLRFLIVRFILVITRFWLIQRSIHFTLKRSQLGTKMGIRSRYAYRNVSLSRLKSSDPRAEILITGYTFEPFSTYDLHVLSDIQYFFPYFFILEFEN